MIMNYCRIYQSYIKHCLLKIVSHASFSSSNNKPRVVILGTGWGSYSVLKNIDRNLFNVKVVSPRNHFLFTPLLCSTTVGTLEFRSITEPVRNIGFTDSEDYIQALAEEVDLKKQIVICKSIFSNSAFHLPFDKLVIGVGCLNNTFGVPGVDKYAFFLKDVRRLYKQRENLFKVTLIEAANILGSFDKKLRKYAEKKLKERPHFNLLKSTVVEVKENSVILEDGTEILCGLVVWSTGLSPQKFTKSFSGLKNDKGQILTDNFLRVLGDPSRNVYAIGDCSEIQSWPLPCTAQVAERQGRYLAKSLNCLIQGQDVKPFQFQSKGMLAYIGDYKALTDLKEIKVQGFPSWFLWRSAYLTQLGSWRLRMQVPVDWLKTLLFGRDTSSFN